MKLHLPIFLTYQSLQLKMFSSCILNHITHNTFIFLLFLVMLLHGSLSMLTPRSLDGFWVLYKFSFWVKSSKCGDHFPFPVSILSVLLWYFIALFFHASLSRPLHGKTSISYSLIRTHTCVYQGVRRVSFCFLTKMFCILPSKVNSF